MRGEQVTYQLITQSTTGSPPLARGTVPAVTGADGMAGITPACAGNSCSAFAWQDILWDHPRLRGEQYDLDDLDKLGIGSPPLARGTVFFCTKPCTRTGITPACAGNSFLLRLLCRLLRDHPRLRGEQSICPFAIFLGIGSPPLARGTETRYNDNMADARITPACAGNRER